MIKKEKSLNDADNFIITAIAAHSKSNKEI